MTTRGLVQEATKEADLIRPTFIMTDWKKCNPNFGIDFSEKLSFPISR